jgi:valyl-tRNA synthetase
VWHKEICVNLPKVYEPGQYESDIYALWEKSEAFAPKNRGGKGSYSIVMPPPNANGNLHLGHALTNAVQDIAIRYHRMKGETTLYLPGTDHAGFETQVVYEKQLEKEGKSRFDFSRDELYQQVWDFVEMNRGNFELQIRSLGASVDWTRHTFTLDEKIVNRAYATFKKMWDEKLIYRGERLVNFCTFHGTAFADIEVSYKEVPGHLWHIKYPLTDGSGSITVATTRPETMLGDTAVAVHPEDDRYKQFLGKTIKLPLTNREIPVIADTMVDKEFGSGAVKITPAHDPNDYEVAQRHDLPMITVIDHEGNMSHEVPAIYRGHNVDSARQLVVDDLKNLELLEKQEDYSHSVGHCYKCGTVIQPLLREQWFVDMQPLATTAIKALHADEVTFYPKAKKEQLITYLKGLRDWNISRQIAWGIPIPAFQNIDDPDDWIYDERVTEETITVGKKTYRRDPDVFDTWFSSSSWPYATLNYPEGEDFKEFYPISLMETGFDILMPWVSRMLMVGLYVTGEVPFKTVYLHGLILDEHGQKMSKSKGNVVNPMDIIGQYGSDALRMGIISGQTPGSNQPFGAPKVVAARNFCNKLWNVARFIEDKIGDDYELKESPKAETIADEWMLSRLHQSAELISSHLDAYRFSEASELVYHLLWDDFADWYIEASKSHLNKSVLAYGLETILKLAHPFAPFVTETIWQTLKWEEGSLLVVSKWPEPKKADQKAATAFATVKDIVTEIRFIRGVMHLRTGLNLYHAGEEFLATHGDLVKSLARIDSIKEVRDGHGLHLTSSPFKCWLDIDQETARNFLKQLKGKAEDIAKSIEQLEARLGNKSYVDKAPKKLVDETKQQLAEAKEQLSKIREEYQRFSSSSV